MLVADLLREAEELSVSRNIPLSDLHYLISDILHHPIPAMRLMHDLAITEQQFAKWQSYLSRRISGEPPQYITGTAWFYGLELKVSPDVLIPRPETEGLVELAQSLIKPNALVVDIGTGSGAIAIALKHIRPDLRMIATDISEPALIIARENALTHSQDITFVHADLLPDEFETPDAIISNPPYISSKDYLSLPDHILKHEPESALHAGEDGLDYYRRIIDLAVKRLSPGAQIFFEIGYDQADAIKSIAKNIGITIMESVKDLAGLDRYIILKL